MIIKEFLKQRIKNSYGSILFILLMTVFFYLMKVSLLLIAYGLLLCTVMVVIVETISFIKFRHQYLILNQMLINQEWLPQQLPAPVNGMEKLYTKLLLNERENSLEHIRRDEQRYQEMMEYYTIWAHQIKTPIAAMGLILQHEETSENRELKLELLKISQYADMVLQYLRLDAEQTDYRFSKCDLDRIIRESIKKWAGLFIRKKLTLVYEGTDESIISDEKWLSFLFDQFLSNSLKYTTEGSIKIQVMPGKLMISDTGIGIRQDDLPRICQRGYTGFNGRMDKKATGIGLYLCQRVTQQLGIQMDITSEVGVGTTVSLSWDDKMTKR